MPDDAAELVLEFEKEKDTKRTVRYKELGEDPICTTLYVRKAEAAVLGDNITLTLAPKQ